MSKATIYYDHNINPSAARKSRLAAPHHRTPRSTDRAGPFLLAYAVLLSSPVVSAIRPQLPGGWDHRRPPCRAGPVRAIVLWPCARVAALLIFLAKPLLPVRRAASGLRPPKGPAHDPP